MTFADRYTLEVAGERVELARHGSNHSPDNVYIHFPDHDTLMLIDIVNAGWVPIYNLNLSEDLPGYSQASATAPNYPGGTSFAASRQAGQARRCRGHQQYIADIEASAKEALASVDPLRLDYGPSGPVHP